MAQSHALFRQPLSEILNPEHPLVKLANVFDGQEIERSLWCLFPDQHKKTSAVAQTRGGLSVNRDFFSGRTPLNEKILLPAPLIQRDDYLSSPIPFVMPHTCDRCPSARLLAFLITSKPG